MSKGQSLIIEFLLFFMVSFSLFAVFSSFFHNQNEFFKEKIGERLTDIVNHLVSIHTIKGISCFSCDSVQVEEDLPSKIGGYYYLVSLGDKGLNTTLVSMNYYSRNHPMFNLNETLDFQESQSKSENKIIEIQINNIKDEVVIN